MERYEVSLCIQFEGGKSWTRKKSVFGDFSRSESLENLLLKQITKFLKNITSSVTLLSKYHTLNFANPRG